MCPRFCETPPIEAEPLANGWIGIVLVEKDEVGMMFLIPNLTFPGLLLLPALRVVLLL